MAALRLSHNGKSPVASAIANPADQHSQNGTATLSIIAHSPAYLLLIFHLTRCRNPGRRATKEFLDSGFRIQNPTPSAESLNRKENQGE
jgi:hypothetical protein